MRIIPTRKCYSFANNAEQIRSLAEKHPGCAKAIDVAKDNTARLMHGFSDDVTRISGWAHNFCCPKCASSMVFDFDLDYSSPHEFTCPHCGTKAVNRNMDEAWVYYYRHNSAVLLESVALCAVLGDEKAYGFIEEYIDFYADRYPQFPVHGKQAGKGKIMGQSLDEAVWAIYVLRAVHSCGLLERISAEKKTHWFQALFQPMAELLFPQSNYIHNIPTWHLCAIGVIAITFGDSALLDRCLNSEFGLRNQVKGFTADGIWGEGALTYHYYTAEALTEFCSLFAVSHYEDPLIRFMEKVYTAPLAFASDGWRLQAVNDGWYPRTLATFSAQIIRAARILPALSNQSRMLCRRDPQILERPTVLFLLCEENDESEGNRQKPADTITIYSATNLAFITTPVWAMLKSGVLCQSHMHCDYLSLIIPPFSDDLGTPGYGHPLTDSWYRTGAAHNLVTVDGNVPKLVLSSHVERTENGARGIVDPSPDWYNVRGERTLEAVGEKLCDHCRYEAPESHTYDWIFHSKGRVTFSCAGESVDTLDIKLNPQLSTLNVIHSPTQVSGHGYEYFTDIRKMNAVGVFTAEFTYNGQMLFVSAEIPPGIEVYTAQSPDNPADTTRTVILLRQLGRCAEFKVTFSYAEKG